MYQKRDFVSKEGIYIKRRNLYQKIYSIKERWGEEERGEAERGEAERGKMKRIKKCVLSC